MYLVHGDVISPTIRAVEAQAVVGDCCWTTGLLYPGTCAGAPKQSKVSWGCNTNSKSCRRVEVYESEEDEFEEQVEAAKTKNFL